MSQAASTGSQRMSNEEYIELIKKHPEEVIKEAARQRLINFARYMRRDFVAMPFHKVYYEVLDLFAHGVIRKLIIQQPPQHGKALPVDTPVLTTEGWKMHGELQVGDYVFGEDGKPKKVLNNFGTYKWHTQEVVFADGDRMIAAKEHLWKVYTDRGDCKRKMEIIETQELLLGNHRRAPYIQVNSPLDLPPKALLIDPYILGLWLGDGAERQGVMTIGTQDVAMYDGIAECRKVKPNIYRCKIEGLTHKLRQYDLIENKHIPIDYLLSSIEQRKALLSGLMDTDGYTDKRGRCEFSQNKGQLADDVFVLLRSLGYKPTMHEYDATLYGSVVGRKVRITFTPDKGEQIYRLERKQKRIDEKQHNDRTDKKRFFVKAVNAHCDEMVNCIQVEGGMYLAGLRLVPTHNSEGSSRMLPSFMLGLNPDAKLCIGSYSTTIARDFNRDVQRIIDTKEYSELFPNSFLNTSNVVTVSSNYLRNSEVIEMVGHRGGLRVVGRGGSLTSKTVDVSILDDVYKDYAEGNSPVIRESAWKWYTTVVRTRLHNDSQELIVFTRWHDDDLIGRIEKSGEQIIEAKTWQDLVNVPKGAWLRINFEAIKESEPTELDPRPKGSALWDSRHSLEKLLAQRALDPVQFNCLFQGNPSSVEGRLYQPFKTYIEKADWGEYVRTGAYVDVADEGSDYLAAVSYDIYKSENTVWNEQKRKFEPILYALVTDIEFTDESTDVTTITVPNLINRNGVQKAWIESNNGGAQFEKVVRKKIKALTVPFYQSGNKESRVITASAVVNSQIIFPFGWEKRYPTVHEHLTSFLRNFSANAHDDIEDCLTGIAEKELVDGNCLPYGHGSRGVKVH